MSHWTNIETEITDEKALLDACQEMGFVTEQNGVARGYNSMRRQGQIVIRLPGPYDIAANRGTDKKFVLTTDWYAGHVQKSVGANFKQLVKHYGASKATIEAKKQGLQVRRIIKQDGGIRLQITGRTL